MHFKGVVTLRPCIYVCRFRGCTSALPTRSNLEFIYSHITRGHLLWIEYVQWTTNKSIKIFFVLIFYWHVWAYRATKCRSLYRVCIWINKFLDNEKAATCKGAENVDDDGLLWACISIEGKWSSEQWWWFLNAFYIRELLYSILYDIRAECRCMISNTVSWKYSNMRRLCLPSRGEKRSTHRCGASAH